MSAQVISFPRPEAQQFLVNDVARIAESKKEGLAERRLAPELIYQALLYLPHPTPEHLLRESFLLDCD